MKRCPKNIVLIFGYVIIVSLILIPAKKTQYRLDINNGELYTRIRGGKVTLAFSPLLITSRAKFNKLTAWSNSRQAILYQKQQKKLSAEMLADKIWSEIKESVQLTREMIDSLPSGFAIDPPEKYSSSKRYLEAKNKVRYFEEEIEEDKQKWLEEFRGEFGENPYCFQLALNTFLLIVSTILIMAGFAYILFCVVLRKEKA